MRNTNRILRIFMRIFAFGVLFLVTFGVFSLLLIAIEQPFFERRYREKVGIERPHLFIFPVLVISPVSGDKEYNVEIVFLENYSTIAPVEFPGWDKLGDSIDKAGGGYAVAKNSQYSFIIPQGQEKLLNKQISQNIPVYERTIRDASFKVTSLDGGRQLIKVSFWYGDRVDVVWYEATDKVVIPKHFFHYSENGYYLISHLKAFAAAIIVWIVGSIFYCKKKRRSQFTLSSD